MIEPHQLNLDRAIDAFSMCSNRNSREALQLARGLLPTGPIKHVSIIILPYQSQPGFVARGLAHATVHEAHDSSIERRTTYARNLSAVILDNFDCQP